MAPLRIDRRLLLPAVEAARRVLHRMDDDEIPAALRRVAASSARRLPPPLLARLVDELDRVEWLRGRALEEWEAGEEGEDPAGLASGLFLRRPEGWEAKLEELEGDLTLGDVRRRGERAERERDRLARRVSELEETLEALRRERDAAAAGQGRDGREMERLRERNQELRRARSRLEEEREACHATVHDLEVELEEADARIRELREALLKARRAEPDAAGAMGEEGGRGFGRGSALEMARALDQLRASLVPPPGGGSPTAGGQPPAALPEGIRPDRPEAIDWLLRFPRPLTLLVDGHNVAYELADPPDVEVRRRLVHELARLGRLAEAPVRCVLFFDSRLASEVWTRRGVEVRYVPSADQAIVDAAGEPGRVVVVTSDREVRERCEAKGALALWGSSLAGWVRR